MVSACQTVSTENEDNREMKEIESNIERIEQ